MKTILNLQKNWRFGCLLLLFAAFFSFAPLEVVSARPMSLPAAFGKTAPLDTSTNNPISPTLAWEASAGATSYQYCIDTSNNGVCNSPATWETVDGSFTSVTITGLAVNTTYYWQVRATDESDSTYADLDTWWSFTTGTPPGEFAKSLPVDGSTGKGTTVTLSWSGSALADSYAYCIDTINDGDCNAEWIPSAAQSAIVSGLLKSTTYYWQARASNPAGETYADSGAWWSFTTTTNPGPFFKISPPNATGFLTTSVILDWSDSPNAASYSYCFDTVNDNACGVGWTSAGSSTQALITVSNNTTYYWQARATNSIGTIYADDAAWFQFSTGTGSLFFGKTQPAHKTTGQSTAPTLKWQKLAEALSYEYCIDTSNNKICNTTWNNVGNVLSASLSGLNVNTIYYWQVRANTDWGIVYANRGNWFSFTTWSSTGPFGKISPSNGALNRPIAPTLSWNVYSGATRYEYCVDTINDNNCNTSWVTTTSTSIITSGLKYNTSYYWQVRAYKAGFFYADNFAWWSFKTGILPGAFTKTAPVNAVKGQLASTTLSWAASVRALSYSYCLDMAQNTTCDTSWVDVGSATTTTVHGLLYGKTYYWQVRATNAMGSVYANANTWWSFNTLKYTDDSAMGVKFGEWYGVTSALAHGGSYFSASTNGQTLYYRTVSTDTITLVMYRGPDQGKAELRIDGILKDTLDLYASTQQHQQAFTYSGLAYTNHNITLTVLGQKNDASGGTEVRFDAFLVNGSYIEDTYPTLTYSKWQGQTSTLAYNSRYHRSSTAGSAITFTVTGVSFGWLTSSCPSCGIAEIYVDNVLVQTVDLYSPSVIWQYPVILTNLTNATHTVKIVVTGTKNASATAATILFDGFLSP